VSGGVACILGVVVVARLFPELRAYHASESTAPDPGSQDSQ